MCDGEPNVYVAFVERFFPYCVKEYIATRKEVWNTTKCLQTWLLDSDELKRLYV